VRDQLGSRKRFLYRITVYTTTPIVGLVVLFMQWGRLEGMLLGAMGIVAGLLAQYMIFSRLRDPKGAVLFALRPQLELNRVVQKFLNQLDNASSHTECAKMLANKLSEHFPDVPIEIIALTTDQMSGVMVSDDHFFLVSPSDDLPTSEIATTMEELEVPFRKHHYRLVLLDERSFSSIDILR